MSGSEIPRIETDRLILRPHRADDLDAYAALWADPVIVRYTSDRPLSREEAWVRILRYAGMWRLLGLGFWAVEARASGALVGEAGFHELRRDIAPSFEGTPEAGWMLLPALHGRGLAKELVAAMLRWGDANLASPATVCIVHPQNAASLALAHAYGYAIEAQTEYQGTPTLVLRRAKP